MTESEHRAAAAREEGAPRDARIRDDSEERPPLVAEEGVNEGLDEIAEEGTAGGDAEPTG